MKKLSISLLVMVTATSFCLAQNSHSNFELSKFRDLGSIGLDYDYLNEVQNGLTPNQVKYLENLVSYWDVTRSKKFDGRKHTWFSVTFKLEGGHIEAFYNSKGKIISATERFSNFALPKPVIIAIVKKYPNWNVIKNRYSVWYKQGSRTKKRFKVQIKKDGQKKWLKIDSSGKIS